MHSLPQTQILDRKTKQSFAFEEDKRLNFFFLLDFGGNWNEIKLQTSQGEVYGRRDSPHMIAWLPCKDNRNSSVASDDQIAPMSRKHAEAIDNKPCPGCPPSQVLVLLEFERLQVGERHPSLPHRMPIDFLSSFKVKVRELQTAYVIPVGAYRHLADFVFGAVVFNEDFVIVVEHATDADMVNLVLIHPQLLDPGVGVLVLGFSIDDDVVERYHGVALGIHPIHIHIILGASSDYYA